MTQAVGSLLSFRSASVVVALALAAGCASRAVPSTPATMPAAGRPAEAVPATPRAPVPAAAADLVSEVSIRAHMEFLASDALNGRGSGTRDEWIAATYIASHFRRWGLEPMGDEGDYVQRIEIAGAEATAPPALTAGALSLRHGQGMVVWTLGGPGVSGRLEQYQPGASVMPGAVVLLPDGVNANTLTGAALVLAPATAQVQAQWATRAGRLLTLPARPVRVAAAAPRTTLVYLDEASYAAMSALPAGTPVTLSVDLKPAAPSFTWNAVGRLTGSDPGLSREVIVLSAHLDHVGAREVAPGADGIFNGADDDASGTVAVMELAQAIARGPRPKRTLVFALFGSEERGGHGAGYFVDLPVVPLDAIVADLQFEMLGRADPLVPPHALWLTGYERSNLGAELARQGARLVADPRPEQSFFTRSDNIRFARRGIVAHTVSSFNLHQDYHRPSDEVKTIDFTHMTDAIRSMLEPVRWFADSTFRPEWAPGGCPAPCR